MGGAKWISSMYANLPPKGPQCCCGLLLTATRKEYERVRKLVFGAHRRSHDKICMFVSRKNVGHMCRYMFQFVQSLYLP